jgi:hypothetical protein
MRPFHPEDGNPLRRHRGGVPWDQAQVPVRWHVCVTQTMELSPQMVWTHWCACGATKSGASSMWVGKNSRKG